MEEKELEYEDEFDEPVWKPKELIDAINQVGINDFADWFFNNHQDEFEDIVEDYLIDLSIEGRLK